MTTAIEAPPPAARIRDERLQDDLVPKLRDPMGDPDVHVIAATGRHRPAERVPSVSAGGIAATATLRLAVQGWTAFAQDVAADWFRRRRQLPRAS
jgi:hypothetical protein